LQFVSKYQVEYSQFQDTQTWVIIVLLSVLVSVTLFGVAIIFIYYQKLFKLYRFQQNFINGFTHELKTPIASLRLYLDTFKKYELSREEQAQYIKYMVKDTERLTLNVNQILHIAKIEDRSFRPTFKKVKIFDFIKKFIQRNPHYFEDIQINLKNLESEDLEVEIEPDLFEMVVMNIMTNAVNYNETDSPKLEIEFKIVDHKLNIVFSDNGIGIEKHEFKNVFKKMYQVGKTTKGSGLGLYLSNNIVKIHKGKLRVTSEGLNKGTKFTVRLPLNRNLE
jgi:two-component system phosphate regulon sensor histidine kinase PhoR